MSARGSFKRITPRGLLSFGPEFEGIELGPLNVLIGPNGSGKSNFLDIISVLAACPKDVAAPIRASGGIENWLHNTTDPNSGAILSEIWFSGIRNTHSHSIHLESVLGSTQVTNESLEVQEDESEEYDRWIADRLYLRVRNAFDVYMEGILERPREQSLPFEGEGSVLSVLGDPISQPRTAAIAQLYDSVFMFTHWQTGRNSPIRKPQSSDSKRKRLEQDFSNLALILNQFQLKPPLKTELISKLKDLYEGITGFEIEVVGGTMQIFITEEQKNIPASRLSDGTLKYLCLLALLCDPAPPPVICIEEPETGLHPDLIVNVARLLKEASTRTQIIVTTHSEVLVDALNDSPEDIIVCEKVDGQTQMKRLSKEYLAPWLENYSLGDLWTRGTLGGNRW